MMSIEQEPENWGLITLCRIAVFKLLSPVRDGHSYDDIDIKNKIGKGNLLLLLNSLFSDLHIVKMH